MQATIKLSAAIDDVAQVVSAPKAESRGLLRVSADSALHVIPILAAMKRYSNGFAFSMRVDNSAQVIAQILNNETDVSVMAQSCQDARLYTAKIREDPRGSARIASFCLPPNRIHWRAAKTCA